MSSFWFVVLCVYGVDREEEQETNTLEIENDFGVDCGRARPTLGRQSGSNESNHRAAAADLPTCSINIAHSPPVSAARCWPSGEVA